MLTHLFSRMKKDWITVYKCLKGSHMKTLRKACSDSRGLLKEEVMALKLVNNPSESAVYWIDIYVDLKKIYSCHNYCNEFVRNCKHHS